MRILSVYNAYLHRGGEDEVFEAEAALLEDYGHDVTRFRVEPDDLIQPSLVTKSRLAVQTIWSQRYYRQFRELLNEQRPDVVHFHNTFPLISPAAYSAVRDAGIAVVQTLHNYRLLCPNAYLFRDGHICEDCVGKTMAWPGVVHACYHDSRVETTVVATMLAAHRMRGTWQRDIDRYIVLTEFARGKFVDGGLPRDKLVVKQNFIPNESRVTASQRNGSFLFVGRLSSQKGIPALLSAWRRAESTSILKVLGDGPMEADVVDATSNIPNIVVLGRCAKEEVFQEMRKATALIFPSEWYEGLPLTIVEAFSMGLPVLASRHGAMAEIVEDGRTGLLFEPGNAEDLATKIRWASENPLAMERMGTAARSEYESKYTTERNHDMLMDIYRQAIQTAARRYQKP